MKEKNDPFIYINLIKKKKRKLYFKSETNTKCQNIKL